MGQCNVTDTELIVLPQHSKRVSELVAALYTKESCNFTTFDSFLNFC